MKIFTTYYLLLILVVFSCSRDKSIISNSSVEYSKFSKVLIGYVELENQSKHSNALVYIDSLDIGASSDSLGYFTFQFSDDDSVYSGIFNIYYYLADYDLDSAKFAIEKGQVVNDSLDVGSSGKLILKQLRQLILVDGITDKYEYEVGDTLLFTARITNICDSTINIRIFAGIQLLRNVVLYNDEYPPFSLTPDDVEPAEAIISLQANQVYEECAQFRVPIGGYLNDSLYHMPRDEYLVVADAFEIIRTDNPIKKNPLLNKIENYIRFKWYNDKQPVNCSPKLDIFPNKYEFPNVFIED